MLSCSVVFDPALLTFSSHLTRDEFMSRVKFLAAWARIARSGEVQLQVAAEVRKSFIRAGYYPAHDKLAQLIDGLELRFRYAPEDVIGAINTIFSRASTSAYCCVADADHESFASSPSQPWYPDEFVNEQVQRTLVLSSLEDQLHGRGRLVFASLLNASRVEFTTRINIVVPDTIPGFQSADLPRSLGGTAMLVESLEAVFDSVSADDLWATSSDGSDMKKAIQMRCREKLKKSGRYTCLDELPEFFVGSDFYASLVRCQAAGSGKYASVTLEACASAVIGLDTIEWKPFDKPARKADGALPLRAHLTKSGLGLRLMAWRRGPNRESPLEFANIGEKWEEEIHSPDPTRAL